MARISDTQRWLLANSAEKDRRDSQDRGPGQSRTPRVDLMLDEINEQQADS